MNIKQQLSLAAVASTVLLAFAGSARADDCKGIESFGLQNRPAIEKSLTQHFVSRADAYLSGNLRVQNIQGCRARVKMDAYLRKSAGSNPEFGTVYKNLNGSMEMFVYFDAKQGNKLCVTKTDLQKVQWADHGPVKEKLFVRRNDDKNFFEGCLL
jgi:hypothetical protein